MSLTARITTPRQRPIGARSAAAMGTSGRVETVARVDEREGSASEGTGGAPQAAAARLGGSPRGRRPLRDLLGPQVTLGAGGLYSLRSDPNGKSASTPRHKYA